MLFFLDPCRSITSMRIRVLFIKQPRIATDHTDCHGCCSFIIRADPSHLCRSVFYSSSNHGLPRIIRIATDVFILNPCSSVDYSPSCSWRLSIIAVLRYVDPCRGLPCRARRLPLAECRPKFISVAAWEARLRECSTPSIGFNLCENCYKSGMRCAPSG